MILELESGTDIASHALHDPGATTSFDPSKWNSDRTDAERVAEAGQLLLVNPGSDGSARLRIYVDEVMPPELASHAAAIATRVLLRVPTGSLRYCGLEYVNDSQKIAAATPQVPAGNYVLDFFITDWDWDETIEPVLAKELGSEHRRQGCVGPVFGFLLVAGLATLVAGIAYGSWGSALAGLGISAAGIALMRILRPSEDYERRHAEIAARYPPMIAVMQRLPDGADLSGLEGASVYPEDERTKRDDAREKKDA